MGNQDAISGVSPSGQHTLVYLAVVVKAEVEPSDPLRIKSPPLGLSKSGWARRSSWRVIVIVTFGGDQD